MHKFELLTTAARGSIENAIKSAGELGHTYVGSEHILLGIARTENSIGAKILRSFGIGSFNIKNAIQKTVGSGSKTKLCIEYLTENANSIISNACRIYKDYNNNAAGTDHLLLCILQNRDCFANDILKELGTDVSAVINDIILYKKGYSDAHKPQSAKQSVKNTDIEKYSINLTQLAEADKIDPIIGREEELSAVIATLCRRNKNNPLLIGEPGVGKTAIVKGLADKIYKKQTPPELWNKQIYELDLTRLVAGTKYRGDFEDRVQKLIADVRADNSAIIFIDEIHTIVGAGSAEGSVDASNMLKPALTSGDFRVIGATTYAEYKKSIEKDSALERRFKPIFISEPTKNQTIEIIKGIKDKYEEHHKISINDDIIIKTVELTGRYMCDRRFPDKAIDVIDEAAANARLFNKSDSEIVNENKCTGIIKNRDYECAVCYDDIINVVAKSVKIPQNRICGALKNNGIAERLSQKVIGQDNAVKRVSAVLTRSEINMEEEKRPIASFLFCGPTGVGKTYFSKQIAECFFGDETAITRLDMSEYSQSHTVSRLIGSPPGYKGNEEGGQLTEAVRKKPYCVVLFDEIEKAHPDIYNILLQITDEGFLTDCNGRKVDFSNTVIVLTSNVGSDLKSPVGFERKGNIINTEILKKVKQKFKPELIARLDEIVTFDYLDRKSLIEISKSILSMISKVLHKKGISIEFCDDIFECLANKCEKQGYGARMLKKIIRDEVENIIVEAIINDPDAKALHCFVDNDKVLVCCKENKKLANV